MGLNDEYFEALAEYMGIDLDDIDEPISEEAPSSQSDSEIAEIIGYMNLMEIVIATYHDGIWTDSKLLTENFLSDVEPVVAVCEGKAIVVWQQTAY